MQVHHWWWVLALALGVAEMFTGTFYLLVLALGAVAGGIVAWADGGAGWQALATATVAVIGWAVLWRRHRRVRRPSSTDRNIVLDIGESLYIDDWQADRTARVRYRGTDWTAELDPLVSSEPGIPGRYVITRVVGSRLMVRTADT